MLLLTLAAVYQFIPTTYLCSDTECKTRTKTGMPFINDLYEVEISVRSEDGSTTNDEAMRQVKMAGIKPYVVPTSFDALNLTDPAYHFMSNETRWSFRFSPVVGGYFCYKVMPNFESYVAVRENTFCYRASSDASGLMQDATLTRFGPIYDYDELMKKIGITEAPARVIQQRQEEFVIAQYDSVLPSPLLYKNVLLYSPDCFKSVYALCPHSAIYNPVRRELDDVFIWDGYDGYIIHTWKAWNDSQKAAFPRITGWFNDNTKKNIYMAYSKYIQSDSVDDTGNYPLGAIPFPTFDRELQEGWWPYYSVRIGEGQKKICQLTFMTINYRTPWPGNVFENIVMDCNHVIRIIEFTYMPTHKYNFLAIVSEANDRLVLMHIWMDSTADSLTSGSDTQQLPTQVPRVTKIFDMPISLVAVLYWNPASPPYPLQDIDIRGIRPLNAAYGRYVIFYGNILAMSSQYGYTPSLYMSFADEVITTLVTAKRSPWFVFVTDKNRMFFGSVVSQVIVEVDYTKYTEELWNDGQDLIMFDDNDYLNIVKVNNISDRQVHVLDPLEIVSSKSICPYKEIIVKSWDVARMSRVILPSEDSSLPEHVYLDASDTFRLQIAVSLSSQTVPSIRIRQTRHVNVSYSVKRDWSLAMAIYDIEVIDGTPFSQDIVDNGYCYSDQVIIDFPEAGPSCKDASISIKFTVGCLPSVSLVVEPRDPMVMDDGSIADVVTFEAEWVPDIRLYDEIFGVKTPYTGMFELKVIGGGRTGTSITMYNEEEIERYNYVLGDRIWAFTSSVDERWAREGNSTLNWLCNIHSPCGRVAQKGLEPPDYYLVLNASTVATGEKGTSLCILHTTFLIRIKGISMDVVTMAITLVVSLVVILIGMVVAYGISERCM